MSYLLNVCSSILVLFNLIAAPIHASPLKYNTSGIPKNLLKDSKAVIRESNIVFEIYDIDKAVERITYAITILNENGLRNSLLTEFYDKFMSVRKIESDLYDQQGARIKNGSIVSVKDYSANAGYSLYEDNRVKFLDPQCRTTPFTVEYKYEISYNGLLSYPDWFAINDYNIAVEKSTFTIVAPKDLKFRYLEKNVEKCTITEENGKLYYKWKIENRPAIKKEPFSLLLSEITPVVYSAPSDFEISGFEGNLDTWKNFGNWINILGQGRDNLSHETKEKISSLVSGLTSDYEKIKLLYNYFQNKVRYVSVQIGIGGWQTIDSETVDRLSYGDCKALANYLKSLLNAAGIKSYYTLVLAGEFAHPINENFPSNQFNHVILCVPVKQDTIWLECTNPRIPFGYLGTFTDNRMALLTGDSTGILVHTKKYTMDDNKQIRNTEVDIKTDGSATASVGTVYKGLLSEKLFAVLHRDESDKRKFIENKINIPDCILNSYKLKEKNIMIPEIKEDLNLSLNHLCVILGNRLILKPDLMTKIADLPYRTSNRESGICIRRPYNEIDTIIFRLPSGYTIENIPDKVSLLTKFGEYTSELQSTGKSLIYLRTLKLFNGNYPVSDYPGFVEFCERISVSDENKVMLVKII
jgi:transglutaminase-like putative cysteine protease